MDIPTFGVKEDVNYVDRFGTYIIIEDKETKQVILLQAPNGAYFLPGGEIEENETKEEAIHREVLEELGFRVEVGNYLGEARDYFYSRHRKTYYRHPAYFFVAKSWEVSGAPLEDFNQLKWFSVAEAQMKLKRGSHRWALVEWQKTK